VQGGILSGVDDEDGVSPPLDVLTLGRDRRRDDQLIPTNTLSPSKSQTFTTYQDNQSQVHPGVVRGRARDDEDNHKLSG
jgi:molecular chaperone DnaK (HSP70)